MSDSPELKMWLAVRQDIQIPRGKLAVQAGHGFVSAILDAQRKDNLHDTHVVTAYMANMQPKIVVKAKNLAALLRIEEECAAVGIPNAIIQDAGRTVFAEPTVTVIAVGPCYYEDLPRYVQRLNLLQDVVDTPVTPT